MQNAIKKWFPLFVLPTVIAFIISFIAPFLTGIYLSFNKFRTLDFSKMKWVGLSNYEKAFSDTAFVDALWFTVRFTIVSVITINVIAFLLALLLTKSLKGTNIFRTIFFMPNLIGGIVLVGVGRMLLGKGKKKKKRKKTQNSSNVNRRVNSSKRPKSKNSSSAEKRKRD